MAVLKASLRLCDLDTLNAHCLAWGTSTEQRLSHYRPYITSHFINSPCTFSGKRKDETKRATFELGKLWCYSKCPTVHTLQTTCNRHYAERQIWVTWDQSSQGWGHTKVKTLMLTFTPPPAIITDNDMKGLRVSQHKNPSIYSVRLVELQPQA